MPRADPRDREFGRRCLFAKQRWETACRAGCGGDDPEGLEGWQEQAREAPDAGSGLRAQGSGGPAGLPQQVPGKSTGLSVGNGFERRQGGQQGLV